MPLSRVDVCGRREHTDVIAIDAAMQPPVRDFTNQILRNKFDWLREVLAFAFEASLMTGQAQQTATLGSRRHGQPLLRYRQR